jgi:hypothetical protein
MVIDTLTSKIAQKPGFTLALLTISVLIIFALLVIAIPVLSVKLDAAKAAASSSSSTSSFKSYPGNSRPPTMQNKNGMGQITSSPMGTFVAGRTEQPQVSSLEANLQNYVSASGNSSGGIYNTDYNALMAADTSGTTWDDGTTATTTTSSFANNRRAPVKRPVSHAKGKGGKSHMSDRNLMGMDATVVTSAR